MTETTKSGGTGIGAVLGVLGLVAAVSVGAIALGSGTPAGAEGLERFASCAELEDWGGVGADGEGVPTTAAEGSIDFSDEAGRSGAGSSSGGDDAAAAPAPQAGNTEDADTASDSGSGLASTDEGGTNTVVEGVDEIDVLDRVGDDRLLISRNGALALVDLTGRTVVAELDGVPYDARISVADDLVWIAGSSSDGLGTEVRRVRIDGDTLVDDGRWTTPGYLIDARRTGDTLHVVAVDYPQVGVAPFDGGPVPCDEVWRPVAPSQTPAATLVASLPASGELTPTAATEVTGSGGNLLVTDSAVYLATESWSTDGTSVNTGIHRFDLAGLTLTGSGVVPGSVAGPFALNEHDGRLRVATNAGFGFGRGIPIEGDVDVAVDPAVSGPAAVEETGGDVNSLAEVFVLDLEGDLDIVGQTGRFGHDGETIHGVRFVGDVAYVVTFLQTDPFWVVDLSDPSAPAVVGELEIPGFSGYLHPITDDLVVGFGPDGNGATSARLFDVSDPQAPSVIDELALGDDSPVAYDHHAFVGLGEGRFAVPFTDYPTYLESSECLPEPLPSQPADVDPDVPATTVPVEGAGDDIAGTAGSTFPSCQPVTEGGAVGAIELSVADGELVEVDRAAVERGDANAERVVQTPDGEWLILSWDRLIPTDGGDDVVLPMSEGTGGGVVID